MNRDKPLFDKKTPALTPEPQPTLLVRQADLRTEEILFQLYLREKARADRLQRRVDLLRAWQNDSKAWKRVKNLTRLAPNQKEADDRKN